MDWTFITSMGNMKLSWPLKSHVETNLILISMTFSSKTEIQHGIIFQIVTRSTYHILVQGRCHEIFTNTIKHNNNPSWFLTMVNLHSNKMTQMTQNMENENMNNTSLKQSLKKSTKHFDCWQEACPHLVFNCYSPNMWTIFHSHHWTQQN
jgi:hypothetical protein